MGASRRTLWLTREGEIRGTRARAPAEHGVDHFGRSPRRRLFGRSEYVGGRAQAAAKTAPAASPGSVAASTPGAQGKLDPCSMLTTDQVTAALGEPPAAGKPEPNFDAPECEWDPASGHNGTVTLDVGPWDGDPGVKPLRLGAAVPDIGDEAYDGGNTGLYVHKGGRRFPDLGVQRAHSEQPARTGEATRRHPARRDVTDTQLQHRCRETAA